MTKRGPTGYNTTNYTDHRNCTVKENINTNLCRSNRYFLYTACQLESYNQINMCCVEVAVVSACGGGGCIVVMRWIVVATVRVKHGLTNVNYMKSLQCYYDPSPYIPATLSGYFLIAPTGEVRIMYKICPSSLIW